MRPLKEFYNGSFKQSLFSTLRPQSLITTAHTSLEHTHTGNKELVMTGTLRYAQTPTNQPKAKKKRKFIVACNIHPEVSSHTSSFEQKKKRLLPIIPR